MIHSFETYTVICDNCGKEFSGWDDKDWALSGANEAGWHIEDEKHYCDDCWYWDDDDNVAIDKTRKKP